jgi:hypothetical protein
MKKTMFAVLAVALVMTMLCATALAVSGDITVRDVKAYSDPEMTNYIGTIPAATSLLVRSHDKFADVYLDGKLCYISTSSLLNKNVSCDYLATLKKGTKVYQRADAKANAVKLNKNYSVKLLAVSGDWVLVQSNNKAGVYAFVKINKLSAIRKM